MPTFAALIYEPVNARLAPDNPGFMDYITGYSNFGARAGAAITGGAALDAPGTATTVHVVGGEEGEVVLTDGPYAETKEFLGGFYLLECEDLDAAIVVARYIPAAWRDGGRIEVRPLMNM